MKALNVLPTQVARALVQIIIAIIIIFLSDPKIAAMVGTINSNSIMPATHFLTWIDYLMIMDDLTLVVPLISVLNGLSLYKTGGTSDHRPRPTAHASSVAGLEARPASVAAKRMPSKTTSRDKLKTAELTSAVEDPTEV